MAKTNIKRKKRDDTVRVVAEIHGVSESLVKKVRNGDRDNESILETLIQYSQEKSALIKQLKAMVKIEPQPEKYARN